MKEATRRRAVPVLACAALLCACFCASATAAGRALPGTLRPGTGSAGRKLPGPAEARVEFRFAVAEARLAPALVPSGGAATLEVALRPRAGCEWYEAGLMPSLGEVVAPAGWDAEPSRFDLPAAVSPTGRRLVRIRIRAPKQTRDEHGDGRASVASGLPRSDARERENLLLGRAGAKPDGGTLIVNLRYAVRGTSAGGPIPEGEIRFEEARLTLELPSAERPVEAAEPTEPAAGAEAEGESPAAGSDTRVAEPPGRDDGAGPLLPALVFAVAAILVLAVVAGAIMRSRAGPK